MEELLRDSAFPYMVGRLAGATEVGAYFLALSTDENAQRVGEKLTDVVGWFYEDGMPPPEQP